MVDGAGRFLIPGLWDFHIHLTYDGRFTDVMPALFFQHGITSVRDTGGPLEAVLPVVEEVCSGGARFHNDTNFKSVTAVSRFRASGEVEEIRLYPIELREGERLARRGAPRVAPPDVGRAVLEHLQELSAPFGTEIRIEGVWASSGCLSPQVFRGVERRETGQGNPWGPGRLAVHFDEPLRLRIAFSNGRRRTRTRGSAFVSAALFRLPRRRVCPERPGPGRSRGRRPWSPGHRGRLSALLPVDARRDGRWSPRRPTFRSGRPRPGRSSKQTTHHVLQVDVAVRLRSGPDLTVDHDGIDPHFDEDRGVIGGA